jgi:hypothetical protein
MKKLLGIIVLGLMFCDVGFAAQREIEEKFFDGGVIRTYCIDGYKFVVTIVPHPTTPKKVPKTGVTMVQALEERDGKSLPAKC